MRTKLISILSTLLIATALTACGQTENNNSADVSSTQDNQPTKSANQQIEQSESEYKSDAQQLDYKTLARNPDKYKGTKVAYTGKVVQVVENGKNVVLRVNVDPDDFSDDIIFVNYKKSDGEDRILEDDIVNIWGTIAGLKTYKATLGQQISIPELDAKYLSLYDGNDSSTSDSTEPESTTSDDSSQAPESPEETQELADGGAKSDDFYYNELMNNYETGMINAINSGDFSSVEFTLLKDSNLYNSQKGLVDRLSKQGTTEQLESFEITNVDEDTSTNKIYLTVKEEITVTKKDGQSTHTYNWVYTAEENDQGELQLSDIRKP